MSYDQKVIIKESEHNYTLSAPSSISKGVLKTGKTYSAHLII